MIAAPFRDLAGNEPAWMLEDVGAPRSGLSGLAFAGDDSTLAAALEEAIYDDEGCEVRGKSLLATCAYIDLNPVAAGVELAKL